MRDVQTLRQDAESIFRAGLGAADPVEAIRRHVSLRGETLEVQGQGYDLSAFRGVYVVGAGKAGARMAQAIEELFDRRLKTGIINVKYGHAAPLRTVRVNEAGHPVPDRAGFNGALEIIELLGQTGERDLVLCLLSGGGSALLPCPAEGLTLEDKQLVTQRLLICGAKIDEINAVRKHLSRIKGGRLACLAYPSACIALILSDVIGDRLDSIASGPTVPDESTFGDCLRVLERYGLMDEVPPKVRQLLERGERGEVEETPKAGNPVFRRVQNAVVGSNVLALRAAQQEARRLGYETLLLSSFVEGEAREVGGVYGAIGREILATGCPVGRPACVLSGGETTVTVRGSGLGGRNQELALAASLGIQGLKNMVVLSAGTDGTDGPTDAAGAIIDGSTVARGRTMGLEAGRFLQSNDSHRFLQAVGDLLMTGPTATNVMDLHLLLVG